ncbi:MAG: hypothetical protein H6851_17090 [Geminicoccaceae bacterium]|nr:hypothetical protein [Geminicoccaceae bacterium]MCB9945326.1 hypothetical protein [Geminicoccaceae bacterium]
MITPPRFHPPRQAATTIGRLLALMALSALAACGRSDPYPTDQAIVLCYHTLADVQCYDRPDDHRASRLVGFYLTPLDNPGDNATALQWARIRAAERAAEDDPED